VTAIRADHVSKRYKLRRERSRTLKETVLRQYAPAETVEALRDVTFAVEPGASFGVVGANGSGKSTLLKLLAGTAKPTSGTLAVDGRVTALLEIGAGFHPTSAAARTRTSTARSSASRGRRWTVRCPRSRSSPTSDASSTRR